MTLSPPTTPPIRLGYVKYLNTLPLVQGLSTCVDVDLRAAVPSHLIDMLDRDEIDVGLISLIDAARAGADLALLPVGMIGCDGPTLTVRLFSSVPLDQLTHIHADTDSHTSAALVQVILHELHGVRPRLIPFDARERIAVRTESTRTAAPNIASASASASASTTTKSSVNGGVASSNADPAASPPASGSSSEWPEAMLLIGDKVVTDSPPAVRYPYQLDLGEAWKRLTGLPFMYAVWMCKAERADTERVRLAAALLDRQRRHNRTRLDWIVSANASERAWPDDLARTYLGSLLRYDVTPEARHAAELFISKAAELGLCPAPQTPSLAWANI